MNEITLRTAFHYYYCTEFLIFCQCEFSLISGCQSGRVPLRLCFRNGFDLIFWAAHQRQCSGRTHRHTYSAANTTLFIDNDGIFQCKRVESARLHAGPTGNTFIFINLVDKAERAITLAIPDQPCHAGSHTSRCSSYRYSNCLPGCC